MKTAEVYIKEVYGDRSFERATELKDIQSLTDMMQDYGDYLAKAVASRALKDAAEKAEVEYRGDCFGDYIVDKQSILETEIKLP